jgi:hypothetical protein
MTSRKYCNGQSSFHSDNAFVTRVRTMLTDSTAFKREFQVNEFEEIFRKIFYSNKNIKFISFASQTQYENSIALLKHHNWTRYASYLGRQLARFHGCDWYFEVHLLTTTVFQTRRGWTNNGVLCEASQRSLAWQLDRHVRARAMPRLFQTTYPTDQLVSRKLISFAKIRIFIHTSL